MIEVIVRTIFFSISAILIISINTPLYADKETLGKLNTDSSQSVNTETSHDLTPLFELRSPDCDGDQVELDENGDPDFSKNVACPVQYEDNAKDLQILTLPQGVALSNGSLTNPGTVRIAGIRHHILSRDQWLVDINIDTSKNSENWSQQQLDTLHDKERFFMLPISFTELSSHRRPSPRMAPYLRTVFTGTFLKPPKDQIVHIVRNIAFAPKKPVYIKSVESKAQTGQFRKLFQLPPSYEKCYQKLSTRLPHASTRQGLYHLMNYHAQLRETKFCRKDYQQRTSYKRIEIGYLKFLKSNGFKKSKEYLADQIKLLESKQLITTDPFWNASNLKKFLDWMNTPTYPAVGCERTVAPNPRLINLIDKGLINAEKRFLMVDIKKCKIVNHEYLGHGGGYKSSRRAGENFGHYQVRKLSFARRQGIGFVKSCYHPEKRKKKFRWISHNRQNLSRPGLFLTLRTVNAGSSHWPRVYSHKLKRKLKRIEWMGLDNRGHQAVSNLVVMHSRRYAPFDLSWGCPTFTPEGLVRVVESGIDQNVLSLIWIPQCNQELQFQNSIHQARSRRYSVAAETVKKIGLDHDIIQKISLRIQKQFGWDKEPPKIKRKKKKKIRRKCKTKKCRKKVRKRKKRRKKKRKKKVRKKLRKKKK